jgi:hypothetical protein
MPLPPPHPAVSPQPQSHRRCGRTHSHLIRDLDQIALELVDSKTFSTGVVYLTYRPVSERDNASEG